MKTAGSSAGMEPQAGELPYYCYMHGYYVHNIFPHSPDRGTGGMTWEKDFIIPHISRNR